MEIIRRSKVCFALLFVLLPAVVRAAAIETVPVGNAGYIADSTGFGDVEYAYRIGRTEVTNAQYVEFLNAVAKSDPHGLFNPEMATNPRAGIVRSGSSPNFAYSTKPNFANKPVNLVSFWDAARFVNWLNNGRPGGAQGPGTTEDGAYSLGGITNPINDSVFRNPAAQWFLPTENEWYKSAYHQPDSQGGDVDDYWLYATRSNIEPTRAIADSMGEITNPGANVATIHPAANWNGSLSGNVTTVAGAGPLSQGFYGTFDQTGNVVEWTETISEASTSSPDRIARGGGFLLTPSALFSLAATATFEDDLIGFRVAHVAVPVPLAGDFNTDGVVDAADYVVWRDGLGMKYAPADYFVWRGQFGKTLGHAAAMPVPEISSWLLLVIGSVLIPFARGRRSTYSQPLDISFHQRSGMMRLSALTCAVVAVIAGLLTSRPTSAQTFSSQVVAVRGVAAPDGNGAFAYFGVPVINEFGQIAFTAGLTATSQGSSDNTGIFRSDGTALTQIVREGQLAPDGNGRFALFVEGGPAFNNAGQVAFSASLTGTAGGSVDNGGVFRGDGTSLTTMAREGQTAPDGNGVYTNIYSPALNNAGQVAFRSQLSIFNTGQGVFRADGTTITQIMRRGQAAPDGNGELRVFYDLALNDSGQVAVQTHLINAVSSTSEAIYRGDGGALTTMVRNGQLLPNGDSLNISNPSSTIPALNNGGDLAFVGLSGRQQNPNQYRLFRSDGTTLTPIASEGQQAPGNSGPFEVFDSWSVTLNDLGQVAFRALLPNSFAGVFRGDGTSLDLIARRGLPAPGGNGAFLGFNSIALNNAGQTAFIATLNGTSGGMSDNLGLFFFDDEAGLIEVVRTGDSLLGSTISQLKFNTSNDNDGGMNDSGQIAYYFLLADGRSGVAVASGLLSAFNHDAETETAIDAVPEPCGWMLCLGALPLIRTRHSSCRRRR